MSAKHTPGPWLREGSLVYALQSMGYRKGVEQFCNRFDACVQSATTSRDELEANARLIAAAPDLLKVARMVVGDFHDASIYEAARDAIAKATGEAPRPGCPISRRR